MACFGAMVQHIILFLRDFDAPMNKAVRDDDLVGVDWKSKKTMHICMPLLRVILPGRKEQNLRIFA